MKSTGKKLLCLTVTLLLLVSGAFAKKSSKASKSQPKPKMTEPLTILFHDNCPRTTAALMEEVSLKATIPGYKGIISVTYKSIPEEKHAYPVTGYYDCCERIRQAMEKSTGKKYILTFNTRADKTGKDICLTDKTEATKSVILLIEQQETDVYAFYEEYRELPPETFEQIQAENTTPEYTTSE